MYPFEVVKWTGRHGGGTKEYHLLRITNSAGHSIVVHRWGKVGAWGQLDVFKFFSRIDAVQDFDAKQRSKRSNGYTKEIINLAESAGGYEDLKRLVGVQYWANLGKDNIAHILPGADTTGIKEPAKLVEQADGTVRMESRAPLLAKEIEPQAPTVADRVKANSNWGRF